MADGLRDSDVAEVAGLGHDPYVALLNSTHASREHTFTVTADGHPVAIFGVSPLTNGVGSPWFLATDRILDVRRAFAADTFAWVEWMNSLYPVLMNYTAADNRITKLWLRRAGFVLHPPQPIGVNGKLYTRFARHRSIT